MREEEIRFPSFTYSYLAEPFYLKHNGVKKEDIIRLKQMTVSSQVVGKTCYYNKIEIKQEKELYSRLEQWKKKNSFTEQIEGYLLYILTIANQSVKIKLSKTEEFMLQIWNCAYLDGIRQVLGTRGQQKEKSSFLSLGPGFYGMEMDMTEIIYQILKGRDYDIKVRNNSFITPYTCCGIYIYGENFHRKDIVPCIYCKGTENCDFCMWKYC